MPSEISSPRTSRIVSGRENVASIHTRWPASRGADMRIGQDVALVRPAGVLLKSGYAVSDAHGTAIGTFSAQSVLLLPHGVFTTCAAQEFKLGGARLDDWSWTSKMGEVVSYKIATAPGALRSPSLQIQVFVDETPEIGIVMLLGAYLITTFAHGYAGGGT